ncbi:TIGR04197 family type VII secretion effector [Rummeliibacillus suwonensis]|jgi:hypothetical protein|uniref:TIGR04197 family type VII secretion effector n=1 Tax=Rummeliibacillus suwonensis TaxID=1306154 RepID=UPI001AAF85CA|nr:TIGR04197 family type VII secretion effector [Rummeliibacillus suwonensis]MBO2534965.1 TIGR04197 family type VII secretion effector [Rummeliibacillus suwonensis]
MGEISINKLVFDSTVKEIKNAKSVLEGVKIPRHQFKMTDVSSIEEQLKVIEDLKNMLSLYDQFLGTDLNKLQTIGDSMIQHDEHLANQIKK